MDLEIEEIEVDGQTCFLPTKEQWARLATREPFRGLVFRDYLDIRKQLAFAKEVGDSLQVVLWQPIPLKGWAPLHILRAANDTWTRCRLVLTRCPACETLLEGANIADVEIYWGAENPSEARRRAGFLPRKGCLICKSQLDSRLHLIWLRSKPD